ncbi:urea transporter [Vibrio sp. T187]|uniref:urea transporter n=1 Tax=Vibrio TaxID=662 RepID=UPI0010C999E4|nr:MULTISPECIES: urea transporter [Vibrio]MBW3695943.1 urea transporter [Vibrio sp. T187]
MMLGKRTLQVYGLLNGIGQVYFSPSLLTAFFILCAIAVESITLLFLTVSGAITSHFIAQLTHKPKTDIDQGLYALNGALIALFIGNFYELNFWLWLVTVGGAALTVPIAKFVFSFKRYKSYTSAFIATTWLIFTLLSMLNMDISPVSTEQHLWFHIPNELAILLKGISQVAFINNELSGLLILAALVMHKPIHALWVIGALLVTTGVNSYLGVDQALVDRGLYGYNVVLVTLALLHYKNVHWGLVILGGITSCVITYVFHGLQLLPLTAPFILSAWLMVYFSGALGKYCSINVHGSESK